MKLSGTKQSYIWDFMVGKWATLGSKKSRKSNFKCQCSLSKKSQAQIKEEIIQMSLFIAC